MPKLFSAPPPSLATSLGWIALGLVLLVSFGIDVANTREGGSIDLRNRITGVRLLLAHIDPYFYKWQEPAPPEYCDPYNNPLLPISKTTATPALLLLHAPFAPLPYRTTQFVWLPLQWVMLLGTLWLWTRRCATDRQKLLLTAFAAGFTYTNAWRLHAERGQSYVLLLFLFGVWLAMTLEEKDRRSFWAGLLAGILVAVRPPFLFIAPFLLLHRRRQLPGLAVGLAAGLTLPLLGRVDCWSKYSAAMDLHSYFFRSDITPHAPPETFPPVIEGMPTDLLGHFAVIPYAHFSVHSLLFRFGLEPFPVWPPMLAAGLVFCAWLGLARKEEPVQQLLGMAAWFFLLDLFLPSYRNSYNDVLILNVMGLALLAAGRRVPWGVWLCFAGLPMGWAIEVFAPEQDSLINISTACYTAGACLLLFWFNFPGNPRKVSAPC